MSLLDDLIQDMVLEYEAQIQYVNHAAVVKGEYAKSIADVLLEHADDEYSHAKLLADRINYLGGNPALDCGTPKTANDCTEMLAQDAQSEQTAINRYKQRIAQCYREGDFGTAQIIMGILVDEEEHSNDILTLLGEGQVETQEQEPGDTEGQEQEPEYEDPRVAALNKRLGR